MRTFLCSLVLALPFTLGACTADDPADDPGEVGQPQNPSDQTPSKQAPSKSAPTNEGAVGKAVVHDVKCGCSIDGVGRCGNYILIDGKYVPMVHPTLGKMEWCAQKQKGAKVETVGAMADGKFVAESWKTVE